MEEIKEKKGGKTPKQNESKKNKSFKPKAKLLSTASEVANASKVVVKRGGRVEAFVEELGIDHLSLKEWSDPCGDHPVTHVIRDALCFGAIRDGVKGLPPKTVACDVLDVYGKERLTFARGEGAAGIHVNAWDPLVYEGDPARRVRGTAAPVGDFALLVDIYGGGKGLSAQMVADVANLTRTKTVYVVRHFITDPYGADVFTGTIKEPEGRRTVRSVEGRWFPHGEDIVFMSGKGAIPYPLHSASAEWLSQRCTSVKSGDFAAWLHCSPLQHFESMYLFKLVLSETEPERVGPVILPPSNSVVIRRGNIFVRQVEGVYEGILEVLNSLHPYRKQFAVHDGLVDMERVGNYAVYDRSFVEIAAGQLAFRQLSGLTMQDCYSALMSQARRSDVYSALEVVCPGLIVTVVRNSLLRAIVDRAPVEFVGNVDSFRRANVAYEEARKRISTPGAYAAGPSWKWLVWAIVLCAAAGVFFGGSTSLASGHIMVENLWASKLTWLGMPFLEEVLRSLPFGWLLGGGYGAYEMYCYVQHGVPWRHRIVPFGLHLGLSVSSYLGIGFIPRFCAHMLYNIFCLLRDSRLSSHDLFDEWVVRWSSFNRDVDPPVGWHPLRITKLRTFQPKFQVPEYLDWRWSHLSISREHSNLTGLSVFDYLKSDCQDNCTCYHRGVCSDCMDARSVEFCHCLLVTNGFLWAPRNGNVTMMVALLNRMFVDPSQGGMASPATEAVFLNAVREELKRTGRILEEIPLVLDELPTYEECARSMGGAKGANFMQTYQSMEQGDVFRRKKVQEKWNEQIKAESDGVKPRLITAVTTDLQVDTMQYARAVTSWLKNYFNGANVVDVDGRSVRFCIADAKPEVLNSYGAYLQGSTPLILVSCDDTVLSSGEDRVAPFEASYGESDYSKYDQSETLPFWEMLSQVWTRWGLDPRVMDWLVWCACTEFKGGKKQCKPLWRVAGFAHAQMPTGISVTSIFGSLNNIAIWIKAISERTTITSAASKLGVTIKTAWADSLHKVTFLRGWWLDGGDDHVWVNLPSVCLKMGKSFRDPYSIVKDLQAPAMLFRAIMESVGGIPFDYPILGAFRGVAARLAAVAGQADRVSRMSKDPNIIENAQHKVYAKVESVSRSSALEAIEWRYGITAEEVVEAEALLAQVCRIPAFVSHPVFAKMRDVDYAE